MIGKRKNEWYLENLKKSLICSMIMWIFPQKKLSYYWIYYVNAFKGNRVIPKIMSHNVWKEVRRNIGFSDNGKIFMDFFNLAVKKHYKPNSDLSIDESILFTTGLCPFRVSMPSKPYSYGIKLYSLADKNGFLYDTILYDGNL